MRPTPLFLLFIRTLSTLVWTFINPWRTMGYHPYVHTHTHTHQRYKPAIEKEKIAIFRYVSIVLGK